VTNFDFLNIAFGFYAGIQQAIQRPRPMNSVGFMTFPVSLIKLL